MHHKSNGRQRASYDECVSSTDPNVDVWHVFNRIAGLHQQKK
nr:hypothetical protein [Nicoliella spurrieriana]